MMPMRASTLPSKRKRKLTEAEFLRLPDDGRKYELVDGEAREVPAEVEAQLRAIRDVATLNALYPLAVSAGSLESFAQQLAQRRND